MRYTGVAPADIYTGMIVDVHPHLWEVDILVLSTGRLLINVGVNGMYLTPDGGGVYAMPELETYCLVADPSEPEKPPEIISFKAVASEAGDHVSGRPSLYPGDIYLGGARNGQHVIVGANGTVEVHSTSLCRTMYFPLRNMIRHIAENVETLHVGGYMRWLTGYDEESSADGTPIRYALGIKQFAEDKRAVVTVTTGQAGDEALIRVKVYRDGTDDQEMILSCSVSDGEFNVSVIDPATFSFSDDLTLSVAKSLTAAIDGDLSLAVTGEASLSFRSLLKIVASRKVEATILESLTLTAGMVQVIMKDGKMTVGSETLARSVVLDGFLPLHNGHTHSLPTGGVTGPPVVPVVGTEQSVLAKTLKGT